MSSHLASYPEICEVSVIPFTLLSPGLLPFLCHIVREYRVVLIEQILVFHLSGTGAPYLMAISHPDLSESESWELHRGPRENQCNKDRVSSGRVLRVLRPTSGAWGAGYTYLNCLHHSSLFVKFYINFPWTALCSLTH